MAKPVNNQVHNPNANPVGRPRTQAPETGAAPLIADEDFDPDEIAIALTQEDVNRLSSIVGKNLLTKDDLISQVTYLTCITVDGVRITLEPGLISRLKSRCYKQEFPAFLRETVIKQLHDFAGW